MEGTEQRTQTQGDARLRCRLTPQSRCPTARGQPSVPPLTPEVCHWAFWRARPRGASSGGPLQDSQSPERVAETPGRGDRSRADKFLAGVPRLEPSSSAAGSPAVINIEPLTPKCTVLTHQEQLSRRPQEGLWAAYSPLGWGRSSLGWLRDRAAWSSPAMPTKLSLQSRGHQAGCLSPC